MNKLCLILSVLLLLSACSAKQPDMLERISQELGVDVTTGTLVTLADDHSGFHGDGTTVLQVVVPLLHLPEGKNWHSFPLSPNLSRAFFGETGMSYHHNALFCGKDGAPILPEITDGYWFFLDRHPNATDSADDSDLFSRSSWNFTAAVYDSSTETLYIFRLDT